MKLMLKNVRLSFPCIWEPRDFQGEGKKVFSAAFIMEPDSPNVEALRKAIWQVAQERWKDKAEATVKGLKAQNKLPLRSGDEKPDVDGYAGMMFIGARSEARPLVIGRDKSPLTEADGKPYAGCYVNASIDIWAQDNQFGKRVNASLRGIQFVKDGDAFSGNTPASVDEFEAFAAESMENAEYSDFV